MMKCTAAVILLLCAACVAVQAAALTTGSIGYGGMVVTTHGKGNNLTLSPAAVCSKEQEYEYKDGYIYLKSNPNLVWDARDASQRDGNPVILWDRKTPPESNQLWNIDANGIASQMAPGIYLRKDDGNDNVVTSKITPIHKFGFIKPPYPCPVTCTSHGDPHFTCWSGKKFDFQSANTVLLAQYSGTKIFAVQNNCGAGFAKGVTCNQGIIVQPAGTTETFQLTFTQAFHSGKLTSLPIGTTKFSDFISVTKKSNTLYTIDIPGGSISFQSYNNRYANIGVTIKEGTPQPSLCYCPPISFAEEEHMLKQNALRLAGGSMPAKPSSHVGMPPPAPEFGKQFLVKDKNETNYQYVVTPFTYDPTYAGNYGPYNTTNQTLIQNAIRLCSVLKPGGPYDGCAAFLEAADYYDTCYNDTIATGQLDCAQTSVDTYAALCAEAAQRNGSKIVLPTSGGASIAYGPGLGNANGTVNQNAKQTFTIQSKDATFANRTTGGDKYVITSSGPNALTFTIVDNKDGTYTVSYTPTQVGRYVITIQLNGVDDVGGSPANVTSVSTSTNAAKSTASGPGVTNPIPSGAYVTFTIQAKTASGDNRVTGGDKFDVAWVGGVFQLVSYKDNNDGTYTVQYVAYAVGTFKMNVTLAGAHIAGSPFTLTVQ